MSELTSELAPDVLAACQEGAEEAAGAISRSLDAEFTVTVGEASNYSSDSAPEGFDGAGLAVLMKFDDVGVVALLPESSGLLPDWYTDPDPTGESKLSTLAQELSMLLVPDTFFSEQFQAVRVDHLSQALAAADVAEDAALVALELSAGDQTGQLSLVWPLANPDGLFPEVVEAEQPAPAPPAATPQPAKKSPANVSDFSQLPSYARSLLKIELSVRVVLASKKENFKNIVELASGSIIKFEKPCDEMLDLHVGDQHVAVGEAVKVGDKFGFRLSNMVLPEEHFLKVQPKKTG